MLIGNVYREIVQSPQNLMKKRGISVDVILILNQNLENSIKPLSMVPKGHMMTQLSFILCTVCHYMIYTYNTDSL